ncbi:MAG: SOS response-associated peptidase [Acidobacteria bacterium]|nr:SOS response-associated peptidase [Acidobacteriota bacterium]
MRLASLNALSASGPVRSRKPLQSSVKDSNHNLLDVRKRRQCSRRTARKPIFCNRALWDAWKDSGGHWLQSFAIVTTEANELMSRIHPRMPVILHSRDYDRWLDREETERLPIDLLRPYDSDEMEMYEADPKVGNIRNNGPEMMRAAADDLKW